MELSSNLVTNIIAILSLLVSVGISVFYLRDRRHAKYAIESEYTNNLLQWHGEVVRTLVRLRILDDGERSQRYQEELGHLSALIEQGRFFFPNIDKGDGFGAEKPPAYQGYRNLALDFLVASYDLFKSTSSKRCLNQAATLQRHFTSVVFDIVRPSSRLEMIRTLTDRYFVQEKSFEDFLDHPDTEVLQHIWRTPDPRTSPVLRALNNRSIARNR